MDIIEKRFQDLEDVVFEKKKVIHNRIKGRFGNQLFQFWVGKWIAMNTGMKLSIYFTQGFYLDPKYFPNLGDYIRVKNYIPIRRPSTKGIEGPVGEIVNGIRIYNCAFLDDYKETAVDPDKVISDIKSDGLDGGDVLLSCYNEYYEYIKRHQHWIQTLYSRSSCRLGELKVLAVHVRLGDLEKEFVAQKNDYIEFACKIANQLKLPVVLVTESSVNPISIEFETIMKKKCKNVDITLKHTSEDTVQDDFDVLYRACAIVMGNSTFSWWGAFLNPFTPDVYVGVSKSRQPHYDGRKSLFETGPESWHLWDMDTKKWLRNRPKRQRSEKPE